MSTLTIALLTYNRLDYAKRTLKSVISNIKWSGNLAVHIASDGDDAAYMHELACVASAQSAVRIHSLTDSNSLRMGYGANWNLATQVVHGFSDYVLPLEDDWELTRELDADRLVAGLDAIGNGSGCIRLGYVGYTQSLRGEFVYANNEHFLRLDHASDEPHVFAGHPRLETVAFERSVGPWPEGLSPGETEFQVAHMPTARRNIYWPISYVKPEGDLFAHIGSIRSY